MLLTIFKNNGKTYAEMTFKNTSKSTKEQIVTKTKGGLRYEDIDERHGEYMIVDKKGLLSNYSEDGLFNKMKKQPITAAHSACRR